MNYGKTEILQTHNIFILLHMIKPIGGWGQSRIDCEIERSREIREGANLVQVL